MVSLEVIKFLQSIFINEDVLLYHPDPESPTYANCVCMTLNEELANINIIFSDKTGTLTSNIMEFKGCSIGVGLYEKELKPPDNINTLIESKQFSKSKTLIPQKAQPPQKKFIKQNISLQKTDRIVWNFDYEDMRNDLKTEKLMKEIVKEEEKSSKPNKKGEKKEENILTQSQRIHHFWKCIILCNDVITILQSDKTLSFQGPSSDEITLVDAAQRFDFQLVKKHLNIQEVKILNEELNYITRIKIAFNSDRKCMSVVVEENKENGKIFLYIKGADTSLEKRMKVIKTNTVDQKDKKDKKENKDEKNKKDKIVHKHPEEQCYENTKKGLEKFGNYGYRTLCMGFKEFQNRDEYEKWELEYKKLAKEIDELGEDNVKKDKKEKLIKELESNIIILGGSAIEDKLQDFVPEAIADLRKANIQIWMLTGDKLETAKNIGISCNLIDSSSSAIHIEGVDIDHIRYY